MNDFELKQINELYLFKKKQELEASKYECEQCIKRIKDYLNEFAQEHQVNYVTAMEMSSLVSQLKNIQALLQCHIYYDESNNVRLIQSSGECFYDCLEDYYQALILDNLLGYEFPNGKYRGRIVQQILELDPHYCAWYRDNVIAQTEEHLKLLDYISKSLAGVLYVTDINKINAQLDLYNILPTDWVKYVNLKDIFEITEENKLAKLLEEDQHEM